MEILDAVILGAVQGVTEFLPISSSGHLVLGESILGLEVENLLSFDVAVHVGTLVAILAYFWKDFIGLIRNKQLLGLLVVGTLPVVAIGFGLKDFFEGPALRNSMSVGIFMILVGALFLFAEWYGQRKKKKVPVSDLKWWNALIIGLFQSVALIPGVSRSGSTISGGLINGVKREEAARFSFLLGGVAIAGAAALTVYDQLGDIDMSTIGSPDFHPVLAGFLMSAVVGYFSIYWLMRFLKNHSLKWFAWYLFVVGGVSLVLGCL
jgi:undecaprenyl-diphosphatase